MTSEQRVIGLTGFSHFITHGYMTLLPALLVVIAAEHSLSFFDIGIIANVGYFLYGLGSFPAGYLADRFGSKRVLTVGVGGMGLASVLVGLSAGAAGFAVAYGLLGLFAAIHHPAGLSFIARRPPMLQLWGTRLITLTVSAPPPEISIDSPRCATRMGAPPAASVNHSPELFDASMLPTPV